MKLFHRVRAFFEKVIQRGCFSDSSESLQVCFPSPVHSNGKVKLTLGEPSDLFKATIAACSTTCGALEDSRESSTRGESNEVCHGHESREIPHNGFSHTPLPSQRANTRAAICMVCNEQMQSTEELVTLACTDKHSFHRCCVELLATRACFSSKFRCPFCFEIATKAFDGFFYYGPWTCRERQIVNFYQFWYARFRPKTFTRGAGSWRTFCCDSKRVRKYRHRWYRNRGNSGGGRRGGQKRKCHATFKQWGWRDSFGGFFSLGARWSDTLFAYDNGHMAFNMQLGFKNHSKYRLSKRQRHRTCFS